MLLAWSRFKSSSHKQFKAVKTYMITDGEPHPVIDVKTNFDTSRGVNVPDITSQVGGAIWDVSLWDVSFWAGGQRNIFAWNGVAASGVYGAIRVTADVYNCYFALAGFDITFEEGHFGPP
jgi:hypothetical protein